MKDLEALLRENYNELVSEECKQKVIEFIQKTPTVEYLDLHFIKKLTKVAFHIYATDPESLEDHLRRMYTFNMEGVMKVKSQPKNEPPRNLLRLESHMRRYAGNLATRILQKTEDLKWGEKAYDSLVESHRMSLKFNSEDETYYAAKSAQEAGEVSGIMYDLTKNLEWARKMHKAHRTAANLFFDTDPERAADRFADAGKAANTLFKQTKTIDWAERWFDNKRAAAELLMEVTPSYAALCFGSAGKAAETLYRLTNKSKWIVQSYENRIQAAEISDKLEFVDAPYLFEAAGSAAQIMFETTNNVEWAEKWYNAHGIAADLFSEDAQKSINLLALASEAAGHVFEDTKEIPWAGKSYVSGIFAGEYFLKEDPLRAHNIYELIGRVAETAFDLHHNLFWGKKAFEAYSVLMQLTKDRKSEIYSRSLNYSGNLSKKVFEETLDQEWAQRCYDINMELAAMTAVIGPLSSAEAYRTSGAVAKRIGSEMKSSAWLSNAISCFKKAREFFDSNDPLANELYNEILDSADQMSIAIRS